MRAVVVRAFGGADVLNVEEVAVPAVGPTDALIRVEAVAVNHLDLEIREGVSRLPISLPHVLGREIVGEVVALGDAAPTTHPVGERVVVLPHVPCGRCRNCLTGSANICSNGWMPGIHGWGGYAEFVVVPARGLLAAPDLEPHVAAAVPISFGTAWRALHDVAGVRSGEWVAVAGAGGALGHACLQLARLAGARPIALVRDESKTDFVRRYGAEEVVTTSDAEWPGRVRAVTGGNGADVVIDSVGGAGFEGGLAALADRGRIVVAGGHGGEHPSFDVIDVFRRELQALGVRSQRPDDVERVLALAARGVITPHVAEVLPLDQARRAHELVASRSVTGKVVLVA